MDVRRAWNFRDLTGQRFGLLTVTGQAENGDRGVRWVCTCDCGGRATVCTNDLTSGHSRSCGCARRAKTVARNKAGAIHGESDKSPEYRSWEAMKSRCLNPKSPKYRLYGELGVKVCDKWRNSFAAFLADMGRRPTPKHTLDRYPDPAGHYEPGNCRWATPLEQRHNRRK